MKGFGQVLIWAGLVLLVFSLNVDTSVAVPGGGRVQNFSLMEQRNTYLMLTGGMVLIGVLLFGFGSVRDRQDGEEDKRACPHCAEEIRWEATVCKHCGTGVPSLAEEEGADETDLDEVSIEEPTSEEEEEPSYTYRELREAAEEGERSQK